jgi:hypothetical protein
MRPQSRPRGAVGGPKPTRSTAKPWCALLAYKQGEPRVCAMVRAPTPEAEDRRRLCRERKTLTNERVQHVNRISGLLFSQGISAQKSALRVVAQIAQLEREREGRAVGKRSSEVRRSGTREDCCHRTSMIFAGSSPSSPGQAPCGLTIRARRPAANSSGSWPAASLHSAARSTGCRQAVDSSAPRAAARWPRAPPDKAAAKRRIPAVCCVLIALATTLRTRDHFTKPPPTDRGGETRTSARALPPCPREAGHRPALSVLKSRSRLPVVRASLTAC